MNFLHMIKKVYATPSAEAMALRELEEARRNLLDAQSTREYSESMCRYHEVRIKRLTAYLHTATTTEEK